MSPYTLSFPSSPFLAFVFCKWQSVMEVGGDAFLMETPLGICSHTRAHVFFNEEMLQLIKKDEPFQGKQK